jgi:hypothetical protein
MDKHAVAAQWPSTFAGSAGTKYPFILSATTAYWMQDEIGAYGVTRCYKNADWTNG